MSGGQEASALTLEQRVRRAVEGGQRCSRCFVEVVQAEGGYVPPQVLALAPVLERGIGGSGSVCGVFVAAMLAAALQEEAHSSQRSSSPPQHEWLDAFAPFTRHPATTERCSSLARRLARFARERYGGLECQRISGVEWPLARPGLASSYFGAGGAERCARLIVEAVQAFLESTPQGTPASAG